MTITIDDVNALKAILAKVEETPKEVDGLNLLQSTMMAKSNLTSAITSVEALRRLIG